MYRHTPVMLKEAMQYLNPQPGECIIDGTLGAGGYTFEISRLVGPTGKVIAADMDESAINNAKLKIAREGVANIILVHENFRELTQLAELSESRPAGLVFDLGLSSAQLDDPNRGFSFQTDAPLSMAFGSLVSDRRTEGLINLKPLAELTAIIRDYGEERYAHKIAQSIVAARRISPITTTKQLVDLIANAVPGSYKRMKIHFATRTFQAFRIATNKELENLSKALSATKDVLSPGARIVIVSFHSLEDRIVKHFFRQEAKDCICPPKLPVCACNHKAWLKSLTKKAVLPSAEEIAANPRARSAKLRAAQLL